MTLGFALLTVGAALIYGSIKNMTVADILLDRPPQPTTDIFGSDQSSGGGGGADSSSGGGDHPSGIGQFDGKPVCKWLIPILREARKHGWSGSLTSGYRSPAQQAAACAQTSGPCAAPGESNHQGTHFPSCAVDVSDEAGFQAAMNKMGNPLKSGASYGDALHFSHDGH